MKNWVYNTNNDSDTLQLIELLNYYNNRNSNLIAQYCQGKLPLPSGKVIKHILDSNRASLENEQEIIYLLEHSAVVADDFYRLLNEAVKGNSAKYRELFETKIQLYGQTLIDLLYYTRQLIYVKQLDGQLSDLTVPEVIADTNHEHYSFGLRWIKKYISLIRVFTYGNHRRVLALYYGAMSSTTVASCTIATTIAYHMGYPDTYSFFAGAIAGVVTMLFFLAYHPVVDFRNYDISGRNVLAGIYKKYIHAVLSHRKFVQSELVSQAN